MARRIACLRLREKKQWPAAVSVDVQQIRSNYEHRRKDNVTLNTMQPHFYDVQRVAVNIDNYVSCTQRSSSTLFLESIDRGAVDMVIACGQGRCACDPGHRVLLNAVSTAQFCATDVRCLLKY